MTMNIYDALANDHNELKPYLNMLVEASEHNKDTEAILAKIGDLLIPHSRAEEAVFYNSLRGIEKTKNVALHGFKEHVQAETLLKTLAGLKAINIEWKAAATKLRDMLFHHIAEEEGEIFSKAREVLFEEEAQQMVPAFKHLKARAIKQSDFKNTIDMVANMMPGRFAERMRDLDASTFRNN